MEVTGEVPGSMLGGLCMRYETHNLSRVFEEYVSCWSEGRVFFRFVPLSCRDCHVFSAV